MTGWNVRRRSDLLVLLKELDRQIDPLDEAVLKAAESDPEARLLMTHPGVGPVVSLHPSDEDLSLGTPVWPTC